MTNGELNESVEDGGGDASEGARVDGIVEQVRRDLELGNADDASAVLRERLDQAGIRYSDAELAALAERASNRS